MAKHTCRSGGMRRIPKTECLPCMRAERSDLLDACESALAKAESCLDGKMRLNESHLYDMRAAIAKARKTQE